MSLEISASGSTVAIEMGKQEQLLLSALPGVMATVDAETDPAYERLFPVPYGDDESDAEYRRLAMPEIERARDRDNDVMSDVLQRVEAGRATLSRHEAEACLRAVGAARLAIAARHGFFDQATFDAAQRTPEGAVVAFLGLVQDGLVAALSELEGIPT
jgi:hypothetical protein